LGRAELDQVIADCVSVLDTVMRLSGQLVPHLNNRALQGMRRSMSRFTVRFAVDASLRTPQR
jgi:hypothetical protein